MEKTFFWHGLFFGLLLLSLQNIQGMLPSWPPFANLHPDNTNNLSTLPSPACARNVPNTTFNCINLSTLPSPACARNVPNTTFNCMGYFNCTSYSWGCSCCCCCKTCNNVTISLSSL
ncbi:protein E6A [Equid gammaherpesvirus 2]|nr:protein E6A [Equid gammaherpesvirus 2]